MPAIMTKEQKGYVPVEFSFNMLSVIRFALLFAREVLTAQLLNHQNTSLRSLVMLLVNFLVFQVGVLFILIYLLGTGSDHQS